MADIEKALETEGGGFLISLPSGRIAWIGGGIDDPSILGVDAPLGSIYYRTGTAEEYKKTDSLNTGWTLSGLGSNVATQNADFGRGGNASAGAYLYRAGQVLSNVSGIPVLLSQARINVVGVSNEDIDTFSIEIYQHDGDFINSVLLHTVNVVGARTKTDASLNISISQGKQIAVKTLNAVKNAGVTVGMKGVAE